MNQYIQKRNKTYHVRVAVPVDLRPLLHLREIRKSLKTDSYKEALKLADVVISDIKSQFANLRLQQSFGRTLQQQPLQLAGAITEKSEMSDALDAEYKQLEQDLDCTDPKPLAPASLCQLGEFNDLFHEFIGDRRRGGLNNIKTINHYRESWDLYCEIAKIGNKTTALLHTKSAQHFVSVLKRLPSNMSKRLPWRDMTLPEIIKADVPHDQLLSITTINNHLSRLSAYGNYLAKAGKVSVNPFSGLKLRNKKRLRAPFSRNDLLGIFGDSVFQGDFSSAYMYWLPLIALHTGARLSEICQLTKNDIRKVNEVWCFSIGNDDKQVKNESSVRLVPVHKWLISNGFLSFVDQCASGNLFGLKRNSEGDFASASRYFARLRKRAGVVPRSGKKLDFHSFRHNFIDELKEKECQFILIKQVVGHDVGDITADVYGTRASVGSLKKAVDIADFSDVLTKVRKIW